MPRSIAGGTWPVLVFALIILGGGFWAMAALTNDVTAGAITTLVAAVLGVVGTHVGHVAGHELATQQSAKRPLLPDLDRLTQLHAAGELDDHEFTAAKRKILGLT